MSTKSISNLSLKEILALSDKDIESLANEDITREIKLQFTSAYAAAIKKKNEAKRNLQTALIDFENFDINAVIGAEVSVKNEEEVLKILQNRFNIMFPDEKIDILN